MSAPLISAFVLVVSVLLLVFWLRTSCRSILREQFARDYFADMVAAIQLEVLAIRQALEKTPDEVVDCRGMLAALQRDYEALTYLLRNAATVHVGRYSFRERLLIVDFHLLRLWIRLKGSVGWKSWRGDLLEMTEILQYFANVMGQRMVTFPATIPPP
ncbi:MAG: hypothetical protein ACE5MH_03540 [Terriglobia bacterium]